MKCAKIHQRTALTEDLSAKSKKGIESITDKIDFRNKPVSSRGGCCNTSLDLTILEKKKRYDKLQVFWKKKKKKNLMNC